MEYRSIYITTRDEIEAREIGRILIDEHLAACINYFPVKSIYRWRGEIEETDETVLIAKTRAELVDLLIRRVRGLHSNEVPCIVSWFIEKGNPEYLEWLKDSTEQT
jgi:periplasmic divalent cation tolerance protein